MTLDPTFVYGNYVEASLWAGLGVVALWKGRGWWRVVLCVALIAFGVSDIVETRTGAWYRPWWLLAWKAVCVMVLVGYVAMIGARRGWFKRSS